MFMIMIMMMVANSLMFLSVNHPLSLGVILLSQTIIISVITSYFSMTYWFSYILFLIMIGGMLVLFIYMTSIASNEKFYFSMKLFYFTGITLTCMIYFFFNKNLFSEFFTYNQMQNLYDSLKSINLLMNKFLMFPYFSIFLIIIFFLLITLIAIVKITGTNSGPIRQKS